MASGIAIDDQCKTLFDAFQKGDKIYRAVTFRVTPDNKTVVPETEDWQLKKDNSICQREDTAKAMDLLAKKLLSGDQLSDTTPRWIIMNFEFLTGDARATDKSIFIKWVPDGAKIKPRMVFSSSTKGLIDGLKCSATNVQADGLDDLQEIIPKLENGTLK